VAAEDGDLISTIGLGYLPSNTLISLSISTNGRAGEFDGTDDV